MSSRKITKKVVVKPVPAKKKEPELDTWVATSGTDSVLVAFKTTAEDAAKQFNDVHGYDPEYVYKVSVSYEVQVTTKHVFTEV